MPQFPRVAAQEQHVARVVHPHDAALGGKRLQYLDHFARGNIFQGNDLNAVAGRQRLVHTAHLRRQRAFCRGGEGVDVKHAVRLAHQRGAVHAQHRFQRRNQRATLDRMTGMNVDHALNSRVDQVALVHDVHQHDLDHLAQVGAVKIEHYLFPPFDNWG